MYLENNCENIIKYNFLTKFLHKRKYNLINKILLKKYKNKYFQIIDFGCGTCSLYNNLRKDLNFSYLGIDNNNKALSLGLKRNGDKRNFSVLNKDLSEFQDTENYVDEIPLVFVCFDFLEHINYWNAKSFLESISVYDFDYLFVNLPKENGLSILLKNFISFIIGYRRHREYKWSQTFLASLNLFDYLPNTKEII